MRNKLFSIYWFIMILALPIFHRGITMDSRVYKDILFLIAGIGSLCLFPNRPFKSWSIFSFVFILYCMISINAYAYGNAFFQTINLVMGLALVNQFASNWDSGYISNALALAAIVQSIWIICQHYGWEPTTHALGIEMINVSLHESERLKWPTEGSLDNRMVTAAYLGPLVPFLFRKYWCFFIPLVLVGLILLKSAMGFFALFAAILYFIWRYRPILIAIPILTGIGLFYKFPAFFVASGRYEAWKEIANWIGFTWIGYGQGYFHKLGHTHVTSDRAWRHPHNEYLSLYVAYGAIGCLLVAVALIMLIRNHRKEPLYSASLFGSLAASFGAFLLYISSSSLTFIITLGALLHHSNKTREVV